MAMLGAATDQLSTLAETMTSTGTQCSETGSSVSTRINAAVGEFLQAISTLQTEISTMAETMRSTVDSAAQTADATEWTGANKETFVGAAGDFLSNIQNVENGANTYFGEVKTSIDSLNTNLEGFSSEFTAAMGDAEASCTSMNQAVNAQLSALDQVMNTGLSVS